LLQGPLAPTDKLLYHMSGQRWEVVDAGSSDGVIVRKGKEKTSAEEKDRLEEGAVVEQEELVGERLKFKKVSGKGPASGWVSIKKFFGNGDVLIKVGSLPTAPTAQGIPEPLTDDVMGRVRSSGAMMPESIVEAVVRREKLNDEPWEQNRDFHINNPSKNKIPPFERLEFVSVKDLMELFEMTEAAAEEFFELPADVKRRCRDECQKLNQMTPEKRGKLMQEFRRGMRDFGGEYSDDIKVQKMEPLTILSDSDGFGVPVAAYPISTR